MLPEQGFVSSVSTINYIMSSLNPLSDLNSPQSVIDWEYLHQLTADNFAFEKDLLATFLEDATLYVQQIQEALDERDFIRLGQQAHQLKGSSATVAVRFMPEIAAQLETINHSEQVPGAQNLIDQLQEVLTRIDNLLQELGDEIPQ